MDPFIGKFPFLFHVTRRSALEGIKRQGLLPATAFLRHRSSDQATPNRDSWTDIAHPDGQVVWLRWQNLRDGPLARRLPDTLTPAHWRDFINGMVFLFQTPEKAQPLLAATRDRQVDQIIIRYGTAELAEAGCDIRTCRWNNGYLDRSKPFRPRSFADYRPAAEWRKGDKVQEVTIIGGVPAQVSFKVVERE